MTFDSKNSADPMQRGFHALESLDQARVRPGTGLRPRVHLADVESITYVLAGALIHHDELLAFVADLQQGLSRIAQTLHVSEASVQAVYRQFALDPEDPRYEALERQLFAQAPDQPDAIFDAVGELLDATLRVSSSVENINSILRPYFFLRRSIGPEFLTLLQFYLNHRRFRRSEHPKRVGKSPQELLTGRPHPHWLEMLGYPPVTLLN